MDDYVGQSKINLANYLVQLDRLGRRKRSLKVGRIHVSEDSPERVIGNVVYSVFDIPISVNLGGFRPGQWVAVDNPREPGGLTVKIPYSPEAIKRHIEERNGIWDHMVFNVPRSFVKLVDSEELFTS